MPHGSPRGPGDEQLAADRPVGASAATRIADQPFRRLMAAHAVAWRWLGWADAATNRSQASTSRSRSAATGIRWSATLTGLRPRGGAGPRSG